MSDQPTDSFDRRVRIHVYQQFIDSGRSPTATEAATGLGCEPAEVLSAFRRLARGKALVLQNGSNEILMAEPFSAVPTSFVVESGNRSWWGNCIWDALGIPAMLGQDARVVTSCADCGDSMTLAVRDGELMPAEGVAHYVVPARYWWKNVFFT